MDNGCALRAWMMEIDGLLYLFFIEKSSEKHSFSELYNFFHHPSSIIHHPSSIIHHPSSIVFVSSLYEQTYIYYRR